MDDDNHEYAFDIKLFAVARIIAPSKEKAIAAMREVIHCIDLSDLETNGTLAQRGCQLTECSLAEDDEETYEPFEIDGEEPAP